MSVIRLKKRFKMLMVSSNTYILRIIKIIIKLTLSIFRSSNNFFYEIFFTYVKMSKDSSAKYCQNNKESLQEEKATERYQSFSKE